MKKQILLSLICCATLQISTFAAPDGIPDIIPQTGTIYTHDLETLSQQQIEQQVQADFKNFEKNKKEKTITTQNVQLLNL